MKAAHLGLERGGATQTCLTGARPCVPVLRNCSASVGGATGAGGGAAEQVAGGRRANVAAREADESKRGELGA